MSTVLVDLPARDAVRSGLGENLFVDASAGTGKTTVLVARVVELLRTGVAPAQVAAITFTEAAAAELRHRVRDELERRVAAPGEDPDGTLAAALRDLEDAAFTTLHGFAQRLLSEFPLQAGLPPELEVLTDVEEAVEFERRWEVFLSGLVEDLAAGGVVRRAAELGLRLSALRTLAEELDDAFDRAPDLIEEHALPPLDLEPLCVALDEVLELRSSCVTADDKLLAHLDGPVLELRTALGAARTDGEGLRALLDTPNMKSKLGLKTSWNGCKPQVEGLLVEAQRLLDAQLGRQRDAVARALAARVARFVSEWADERHRTGRLRFHDLLVLARRLLTDVPWVRDALRQRFAVLLLDEFQDTDPLQIEIAVLLASDARTVAPWTETVLVDGRLFVVGDPKQSIYRFRHADIAVYERAKAALGMRRLTLTQNFRCVPGIVDWVNAAFGALMGEGTPEGQPAYSPLVAERGPVGDHPPVAFLGGPSSDAAEAVREREAADVAAAVRRVIDDRWEVADPQTGVTRPVRPRDVAILIRRHATVRLLERELADAGLPYRIESKSLIYSTDEVRDLVTLLTAIDDPGDEVAVVAALRHPALGCDDRSLVDWRAAGGGWRLLDPTPAGLEGSPVALALARLRRLHDERWSFPVGGLVEHVVAELRLVELAFAAGPRPRDPWRRLRFVTDAAHAFHDAGGHLRGFLRWVERQRDQDVRVDEFLVDEPDDDAVRIRTVHGAKGLEYPVVVLLGLDGDLKRLPAHPRLLFDDAGAEFSLGDKLRSGRFDELKARETALHRLEEIRLLYVGATRARDHLLVSLHSHAGTDCHAAALLDSDALGGRWAALPVGGTEPAPLPQRADPPPPASAPRTGADLDAWRRRRMALADAARRPVAVAATTIAGALATSPAEEADAVPARKGRGGTSLGRAVHGTLQTVDLADPADVAAVARTQAAVEGIPDAAEEVAALARTALEAPAVRAAVASGRFWRELYVGAPVEGRTVEGFVDLLVDDGDSLTVVDYKTDRLDGRAAAGAAVRYHPQAAAYALALEAAVGRPVDRCVFVFTRAPTADEVVVTGPALDAAKAAVRGHLRA